MSGNFGKILDSAGLRMAWTAYSVAVIRMVPAGFSLSSPRAVSSTWSDLLK
jgi:hypothetical protein